MCRYTKLAAEKIATTLLPKQPVTIYLSSVQGDLLRLALKLEQYYQTDIPSRAAELGILIDNGYRVFASQTDTLKTLIAQAPNGMLCRPETLTTTLLERCRTRSSKPAMPVPAEQLQQWRDWGSCHYAQLQWQSYQHELKTCLRGTQNNLTQYLQLPDQESYQACREFFYLECLWRGAWKTCQQQIDHLRQAACREQDIQRFKHHETLYQALNQHQLPDYASPEYALKAQVHQAQQIQQLLSEILQSQELNDE